MIDCIEKLKRFLSEQTPSFGYTDASSLMELLYYYHSQDNPIDSVMIRCHLEELDDYLEPLSFSNHDAVFTSAIMLCAAYEKQGFLDGLKVGMRLFSELNEIKEAVPK